MSEDTLSVYNLFWSQISILLNLYFWLFVFDLTFCLLVKIWMKARASSPWLFNFSELLLQVIFSSKRQKPLEGKNNFSFVFVRSHKTTWQQMEIKTKTFWQKIFLLRKAKENILIVTNSWRSFVLFFFPIIALTRIACRLRSGKRHDPNEYLFRWKLDSGWLTKLLIVS